MKNIKYILLTLLSVLAISACSDDKDMVVYDENNVTAPSMNVLNVSQYDFSKDIADNAFSISFTKADWGVDVPTQYIWQASFDQAFSKIYELGTTTTYGPMSTTVGKLNALLLNKGIQPGNSATMYFRIKANAYGKAAVIDSIATKYSNVVNTSMKAYDADIVYPKVYVPGDYNGWKFTGQFLFSFNSDKVYTGVIDFGEKYASLEWGFKITGIADWDNTKGNWGAGDTAPKADDTPITLKNNGGNILCYQGKYRFYRFTFTNVSLEAPTLSYDFHFNTLSIVGDAGNEVSGWGTKEVDMNFDTAKQRFTADVTLSDGVIKFRADHTWEGAPNWGGADGILKAGGDNIKVKAGKYHIVVDLNNPAKMTYTLVSLD